MERNRIEIRMNMINIIKRNELKQQFRSLYADWSLNKLINIKKSTCSSVNAKNLKCMDIIDEYYKKYAYGLSLDLGLRQQENII